MRKSFLRWALFSLLTSLIVLINSCFSSDEMLDQEYIANLVFMQGHLVVGNQLRTEGSADLAKVHLGHPIEEQYFLIEQEIIARDDQPFEEELKEMYGIFRAYPSHEKIDEYYRNIQQKIDTSVAKVLTKHNYSTEVVLAVISQLLFQASIEYQDSITKNLVSSKANTVDYKVVELPEYQDSWGFITVAKSLVEKSMHVDETYSVILDEIDNLLEFLPSPNPPSRPDNPQIFRDKVALIQEQYLSKYAIDSGAITY